MRGWFDGELLVGRTDMILRSTDFSNMTIGEEEFGQAESLVREGRTSEAISAFSRLRQEYRGSWIDRVATERLRTLQEAQEQERRGR